MGIEIKGNNNGIAVEGIVNIRELNLEFGKGITSAKSVNQQEVEDAVEIEELRPSWEEVIPEYLRTGKLWVAWSELRKKGILKDDFQLMENKAAVAHRLVECFHQAWIDLNGRKGNKPWRYFEKFWGFENLKTRGGSISNELETTITKIFREL